MKGIRWQKQSNTHTSKVLAIQKRVASSTWNIGKASRALELGHWETSRALELGHWETSRALELGLSETADRALEWYFAEIMTGNIFILHKTLLSTPIYKIPFFQCIDFLTCFVVIQLYPTRSIYLTMYWIFSISVTYSQAKNITCWNSTHVKLYYYSLTLILFIMYSTLFKTFKCMSFNF